MAMITISFWNPDHAVVVVEHCYFQMTAAGNFESKICTQYCGNTYSAQVN